ncbi:hypothetical protein [Mesorhizobium sp. M0312]|uniref:hypothetical protein n=1 Tax=Mesorhizobium sp. M0312 TaxID=2956934 RepID=UPI00333963B0
MRAKGWKAAHHRNRYVGARRGRKLDAWNQPIHRICSRIEKIFGTWKRSYDLRRMRWRGLAKAAVQIRRTANRLQYETQFDGRFVPHR